VVSYFAPVKPGESIRLRLSETYTAPQSYRRMCSSAVLDGHATRSCCPGGIRVLDTRCCGRNARWSHPPGLREQPLRQPGRVLKGQKRPSRWQPIHREPVPKRLARSGLMRFDFHSLDVVQAAGSDASAEAQRWRRCAKRIGPFFAYARRRSHRRKNWI
jgi:hypothetical protein